jgi:hypothetical protein
MAMSEGTLDSRRERCFLHLIKLFLTASMAMFVYFLDGIYIYIYLCVCVFRADTLFRMLELV